MFSLKCVIRVGIEGGIKTAAQCEWRRYLNTACSKYSAGQREDVTGLTCDWTGQPAVILKVNMLDPKRLSGVEHFLLWWSLAWCFAVSVAGGLRKGGSNICVWNEVNHNITIEKLYFWTMLTLVMFFQLLLFSLSHNGRSAIIMIHLLLTCNV